MQKPYEKTGLVMFAVGLLLAAAATCAMRRNGLTFNISATHEWPQIVCDKSQCDSCPASK